IIYDEAVYDAAQVRIDLARSVLGAEGIDAIGEPGDPDPYTATMDAAAEYEPDLIIISTLPVISSGWLRRDLIERVSDAAGVPVEHVVADIDNEGLPFKVTLVVANRPACSAPRGEHVLSHDESERRAPPARAHARPQGRGRRPAPVRRRDPPGGRRGPARAPRARAPQPGRR